MDRDAISIVEKMSVTRLTRQVQTVSSRLLVADKLPTWLQVARIFYQQIVDMLDVLFDGNWNCRTSALQVSGKCSRTLCEHPVQGWHLD